MPKMRCAEAFVKALEKEGVRYVFGLPGHGNMNILDAIYDSDQINFKLVRHEQAAAHIADGYARITREVGVCCSSVGPGAANMIMGIASAWASSSPILAVSGGIISKWSGRGQLQETSRAESPTDQCYTQLLQPICKKVWQVTEPQLIPAITRRAFDVALAGRPGPVAIEIPWSLQAEYHDIDIPDPDAHSYGVRVRADKESIQQAVELLLSARLPVIVAGYGCVISRAEEEIMELGNLLGAPVATSFMSRGIIPEDDPLSVGMIGWLGHPVAHEIIREHADLIFAVGFRFSDESTSWWTEGKPFVKENSFIQLDIQQHELAKNVPVKVGLLGDAKATLSEMIAIIRDRGGHPGAEGVISHISQLKSTFKPELPPETKIPLEPLRIADELRKLLPRDSILAIDTGAHAHYFAAFYPIYHSQGLLNPGGWTPMGWGPTAILGAKLARPETPCICVTGDGGFAMVCQEVLTAVEWDLPVLWIVFNNLALAAIREGQKAAYGRRIIGTEFTQRADFAAMARAFGAEGIMVSESYSDLRDAVYHGLDCGKPCVIDVIIEQDAVPPPVAGNWCEPERDWPEPMPRNRSVTKSGRDARLTPE